MSIPRFAPLAGALTGALGGAIYWLGAQVWPSNVAVIVSMTGTGLLTTGISSTRIFYLLVKYNALMSLSAAKLPFAVPANVALGVIMICGHAASFALAEAARTRNASLRPALLLGFAPAALLGIPGLVGLAAAIIAGLAVITYLNFKPASGSSGLPDMIQMLTEACFYLGALAAWSYV